TGLTRIPEAMKIADFLSKGKNDYSGAITIYENILKRSNDSTLLANTYINIAIAHFNNKSYLKCRKILESIKDDYHGYYMSTPISQHYYALSFEKLNEWNRAEDEYQWLITNFPNTELAFNSYLTIAGHYNNINNSQLTDLWYSKAIEFYNKMKNENKGTPIEASAISYLAEVARRRANWVDAAKYLEELFQRFPDKEVGFRALENAIEIYRSRLNNPSKADSLQLFINTGT
ncbi:MAG: tetratricopeptide repeat protein, partial [candidate division Zixibacteria bacterium]|nr:tetratricopeptide repeat protein [candidate division Zixibacteria bacterium]